MLKIIFRFITLVLLNYLVINLSVDIDLEQLVKDFELINISLSKDAIILDFFAGSGTTGHAVSLMNKNDGGERQFILCTNNESNDAKNENKIAIDECYPKIKSIIEGNKKLPEITGIKSNLKYYQIEHQSSEFTDSNKLKIFNNALDMILLKENMMV